MQKPDLGSWLTVAESLHGLAATSISGRDRDISLTAASTLFVLDRWGPRRITELAASEGVAQPSMTSLVTGLERLGLVERKPDPSDQRAVLVALTRAGKVYIGRRYRAGAARFHRLIHALPSEERAALIKAGPALARLYELGTAELRPRP